MRMQSVTNESKSKNQSIDCSKECPCGVSAIPVPDQWLEVMVIKGFKVWHILFIFIGIAIIVAVLYCCFHKCRIPRTKQEIESDSLRAMMANKFRSYLLELPTEMMSFLEALRKVQELEEKQEQENALKAKDASARKRKGWLKLKADDPDQQPNESEAAQESGQVFSTGDRGESEQEVTKIAPKISVDTKPDVKVEDALASPELDTNLLAAPPRSTRHHSRSVKLKVTAKESKVGVSDNIEDREKLDGKQQMQQEAISDETNNTRRFQAARRKRRKPHLPRAPKASRIDTQGEQDSCCNNKEDSIAPNLTSSVRES